MHDSKQNDEIFDARMRAILGNLPVIEDAPLPRRQFLRQGLALAAGLSTLSMGSWLSWQYLETPKLINAAFSHVEEESSLRGIVVAGYAKVQQSFGFTKEIPGIVQLCKSCNFAGLSAWHMTLFIGDAGFVHILAFRQALPVMKTGGHALQGYWQIINNPGSLPRLLLATNENALHEVYDSLI